MNQNKHWKNKNTTQIESYWTSPPATKRSLWFVDFLQQFDFSSICECGMFSGRNLKYIHDKFPNVSVNGFDINTFAVDFAKEKLPTCNFWQDDIYNFANTKNNFDIVFTSGTLIHLDPTKIKDILGLMSKSSNKYVINIEHIGSNEVIAGPKEFNPTYKISDQIQYAPDIIKAYKDLGFDPTVYDLPKELQTNGAKQTIVVKVK